MSNKKNASSSQGILRLIRDAIIGIVDLVEVVHRKIVHPPFLPSTPIQRLITFIAGGIFNMIRRSTHFISNSADIGLGQIASELEGVKSNDEREALRSVLNGVVGDYLEENDNPLMITMLFRHQAKAIPLDSKSLEKAYPTVNGKILLMVHGLCMNDIQWTRKGHNHGLTLANEFNKTPIFLHYNTGRHISTNGKDFNELLEKLILHWPVPVEELYIIAHSMGGLISRSAFYYGQQQQKSWTKHLKKIVFLGTPHHGSPLERLGNYVDTILDALHFAKPFARLGKIRSAGITDLRYGNILDEDRQGNDRFKKQPDQRQSISLPEQVACYSIAGTIGKETDSISARLIGDSLVPVKSALGEHEDPAKNLNFKKENTWIAYENNHFDLLSNPKIYTKIKEWLV